MVGEPAAASTLVALGMITGTWRKSGYSTYNGNCLEAAAFRKSSRSSHNGACAEVGSCAHGVAVRDSKLSSSSPVLTFPAGAWEAFTARLKAGAAL